ncbi:hypothetical protein TNCV_971821 [Trichonephila clavipes]|nr:hypothetical protein TNCV_971821 [Trichonephila clavipes]
MHNATDQQPLTLVFPNSNPTVMLLQSEAVFVCKHDVVPFRCPRCPLITPLVAHSCGFQSWVNEAMDALQKFHSTANGVEWYERTPNDT